MNIDTPTERSGNKKRFTEQPMSNISKNVLETKYRNAKTMADTVRGCGSRGRARRCPSDIVSSNFSNSSPGNSTDKVPISQAELLTMRLFERWTVSDEEIIEKMNLLSGKLSLGSASGD